MSKPNFAPTLIDSNTYEDWQVDEGEYGIRITGVRPCRFHFDDGSTCCFSHSGSGPNCPLHKGEVGL